MMPAQRKPRPRQHPYGQGTVAPITSDHKHDRLRKERLNIGNTRVITATDVDRRLSRPTPRH
jgi:hypothetical protein